LSEPNQNDANKGIVFLFKITFTTQILEILEILAAIWIDSKIGDKIMLQQVLLAQKTAPSMAMTQF
jgi:hypothetical protein